MDGVDRRILKALQEDASGSVAEIAERAGVSQTPCWRRIKRLEQTGHIQRRVALLDKDQLNLGLTAFVQIRLASHEGKWMEAFAAGVRKIPEIVELHHMSGDADFMLKIVTSNMAAYREIYKKLMKLADLSAVSANFSMSCLKETTQLPLTYIAD
ncbi:MAG: Lrp/AsnC family transcriptional regulator [Pseudomonadota bacterium]